LREEVNYRRDGRQGNLSTPPTVPNCIENPVKPVPPNLWALQAPLIQEALTMEKPFKLTIRVAWQMQIVQILFALPFTVLSVGSLFAVIKGPVDTLNILNFLFLFLLSASFAFLGWANAFSTIQVTPQSVTVAVFYGRFRIHWDEVENIVRRGPFIALNGNGKRVVLSLTFMGKNRKKMLEFFKQQIEQRHIRFEKNAESFPLTHHNARVWW
jgi:hypothetical protein